MRTLDIMQYKEHEILINKYGQNYNQLQIDKEVHEQENDWGLVVAFQDQRFYK